MNWESRPFRAEKFNLSASWEQGADDATRANGYDDPAWDASEGTGYDTLYADTDQKGVLARRRAFLLEQRVGQAPGSERVRPLRSSR